MAACTSDELEVPWQDCEDEERMCLLWSFGGHRGVFIEYTAPSESQQLCDMS